MFFSYTKHPIAQRTSRKCCKLLISHFRSSESRAVNGRWSRFRLYGFLTNQYAKLILAFIDSHLVEFGLAVQTRWMIPHLISANELCIAEKLSNEEHQLHYEYLSRKWNFFLVTVSLNTVDILIDIGNYCKNYCTKLAHIIFCRIQA